jgi:hypothetical protein
MRRKKRPKYAKHFWTRRFLNDGVQHGQNVLRESNIKGGSGFRNFVRLTKSDFDILLQKIGPIIQRKDTKYREAVPASQTNQAGFFGADPGFLDATAFLCSLRN